MTSYEDVAEVMKNVYGKDIRVFDESFLQKTIDKMVHQYNRSSYQDYHKALMNDRKEAEALFNSLTIQYSLFFRNPLTFAVIEQLVLPHLFEEKSGNSGLRIWSAGCSHGQEPYSLAMMLDSLIRQRDKKEKYRIFATDISETALESARRGIYGSNDLMNVRLKMIRDYTMLTGDDYIIEPEVKKMVDFSLHDLLDERASVPAASIYGDFDLVICSNLLFYYNHDVRALILDRLYSSLRFGGFLVTGEAERDSVARMRFSYVASPAPVFVKVR